MIVKEKNGEGFLDLRICDNLELMAEKGLFFPTEEKCKEYADHCLSFHKK